MMSTEDIRIIDKKLEEDGIVGAHVSYDTNYFGSRVGVVVDEKLFGIYDYKLKKFVTPASELLKSDDVGLIQSV